MISCFGDLYLVNLTPFFSVRFSQKKFSHLLCLRDRKGKA